MLEKLGFTPEVIVDCGVASGEWSTMIRSVFNNAFIIGIDGNDWANHNPPGTNVFEKEVLYSKEGKELIFYQSKLHITNEKYCSGDSIFKENTQHYQEHNIIKTKVETSTLLSILSKHNLQSIDLLKIDTQGSEIEIMKGLGSQLSNVSFIELEVSIFEFNEGGCLFGDVVDFLKDNFDIFDILTTTRRSESTLNVNKTEKYGDFLFQADILFKNKKYII
tara:strand:+ start:6096 stop:6755 length:660 start_codon:yes stop_codon:yes gene_type:complete